MNNKMAKKCVLLILIVVLVFVGIVGWIIYDTVRTHTTQIELNKISQQEKEELIRLDFLELANYPSSLEFILLKQKAEIRETQFYIEFSLNEEESNSYDIEKNVNPSSNEISILKINESSKKKIYELKTNFTQNTKAEKWSYLYNLIEKYK